MTNLHGVWEITRKMAKQAGVTVRHVIGLGLRNLANILLADLDDVLYPPPTSVEPPPQEDFPIPSKPRKDYRVEDHQIFYVTAVDLLKFFLGEADKTKGYSVRELTQKVSQSDKSVRRVCLELIKEGLIAEDKSGKAIRYTLIDEPSAKVYLKTYQDYRKPLPGEEGFEEGSQQN